MTIPTRLSSSAGIAIGPILFVLALLALLAAVMSAGNGDFQSASSIDRISTDIVAQTNMIRSTINQCNMRYSLALSTGTIASPASDPFPAGGTASALLCDPMGTASLWNDTSGTILLPQPTSGFGPWMYYNAGSSGGRCIVATPNAGVTQSIIGGLTRAASKFNSNPTYGAAYEVIYSADTTANPNQKFIVWITLPTGSANSNCLP